MTPVLLVAAVLLALILYSVLLLRVCAGRAYRNGWAAGVRDYGVERERRPVLPMVRRTGRESSR